jgi:hypothetical protein
MFDQLFYLARRRQAFPHYLCNKEEVLVNIDGKILDMYFNGCPICTKIESFSKKHSTYICWILKIESNVFINVKKIICSDNLCI